MRILYLAHRIPYPPNKGDKIRAFHEIRGLAGRGHQVDVLAFADDSRDLPFVADLRQFCASAEVMKLDTRLAKARSVLGLVRAEALSLAYFRQRDMARAVAERVRSTPPDACVVYSSPMAQYVPAQLRSRTVVDLVDVDSEKWRDYRASHRWPMSAVYGIESKRLRAFELSVVSGHALSVLATEREAALLRPDLPAGVSDRLSALVNGVDLEFYHPANGFEPSEIPPAERRYFEFGGPRVVFTGAMDYYANVEGVSWFARDVWPLVRAVFPMARFLVVGSRPAAAVIELERLPGVSVTGFVDDVRPYLWSADVCVAPLRIARGVQNKVLEACACGRPVVATPDAVAGLDLDAGEDVVVAGNAPELAASILGVLTNAALAAALGASGRRYAERVHSWPAMLQRFSGLVESVAEPVEGR
jgi:sugar transferase (PEP-CTERM/EpsH1 system associated)